MAMAMAVEAREQLFSGGVTAHQLVPRFDLKRPLDKEARKSEQSGKKRWTSIVKCYCPAWLGMPSATKEEKPDIPILGLRRGTSKPHFSDNLRSDGFSDFVHEF